MISAIHKALADKRDALKKNEEQGFTLIELLVVVLIIGILAAIAVPVYLGIQQNAKDSAALADLANVKTAIVAYNTNNNGAYPATIADLTTVKLDSTKWASIGFGTTGASGGAGPASNATSWTVSGKLVGDATTIYTVTDSTAPKKG